MKYIITEETLSAVVKAIGDLPVTWNQANPIILGLTRGLVPVPEEPVNQAAETATTNVPKGKMRSMAPAEEKAST